ncbi:fumarylacetoacetate hydrolase family protein [Roseateles chitinivorans]|uniref:fumarylacetoacetate hydrolase family protein n=1 Tax=Roseateles chitinivorans TaxID=2917965 RepID=UPI003D66F039
MRLRKSPGTAGQNHWQLQNRPDGPWESAVEQNLDAWLPPQCKSLAGRGTLPFQPLSFRDCMLYEQHWIQASRGFARRFLPAASRVTSLYEKLSGSAFPAFRASKLARKQPIYYLGNHLNFAPSGTPVQIPSFSTALDYELELGVVLQKPLFNASLEEAEDAIGGFVVVNDWSLRDLQREEMRTGLGPQKCKHFLSSMSGEIALRKGVWSAVENLKAYVEINGHIVSQSSTAGMMHSWAEVIQYLSREERLYAGELIASGTLPGGCGMETGRWVGPGDSLRLIIDQVGEITHHIEM